MTVSQDIRKDRVLELLLPTKIKRERILVLGELEYSLKYLIQYLLPFGPPVNTHHVGNAPNEPLFTGGSDRRWGLIICIGPERDLAPGILRWYFSVVEGVSRTR